MWITAQEDDGTTITTTTRACGVMPRFQLCCCLPLCHFVPASGRGRQGQPVAHLECLCLLAQLPKHAVFCLFV